MRRMFIMFLVLSTLACAAQGTVTLDLIDLDPTIPGPETPAPGPTTNSQGNIVNVFNVTFDNGLGTQQLQVNLTQGSIIGTQGSPPFSTPPLPPNGAFVDMGLVTNPDNLSHLAMGRDNNGNFLGDITVGGTAWALNGAGSNGSATGGDFNGDGIVDHDDWNLLLFHWGDTNANLPPAWINDLPTDNIVDGDDFTNLMFNLGTGCNLGPALCGNFEFSAQQIDITFAPSPGTQMTSGALPVAQLVFSPNATGTWSYYGTSGDGNHTLVHTGPVNPTPIATGVINNGAMVAMPVPEPESPAIWLAACAAISMRRRRNGG